jgi:hypothetical protein
MWDDGALKRRSRGLYGFANSSGSTCTRGVDKYDPAVNREFAHPAEICAPHAPVRVLTRESQDQLPPLPFERRPPRLPVRTPSAARHEAPVAAQQRLRPHRECCPRPPRERPTHRGQQRAIGQLDSRPPRLPPQDRELVTQHQDLQRLRPIGAPDKQHEREQMPEREVDKRPDRPRTSDSTTGAERNHCRRGTHAPPRSTSEFALRPDLWRLRARETRCNAALRPTQDLTRRTPCRCANVLEIEHVSRRRRAATPYAAARSAANPEDQRHRVCTAYARRRRLKFHFEPLRPPPAKDGGSQALRPTAAPATRVGQPPPERAYTQIWVMEIGKPSRTYTVEPLEDPVPRERPEESPEREEPAEPQREPETVPA